MASGSDGAKATTSPPAARWSATPWRAVLTATPNSAAICSQVAPTAFRPAIRALRRARSLALTRSRGWGVEVPDISAPKDQVFGDTKPQAGLAASAAAAPRVPEEGLQSQRATAAG